MANCNRTVRKSRLFSAAPATLEKLVLKIRDILNKQQQTKKPTGMKFANSQDSQLDVYDNQVPVSLKTALLKSQDIITAPVISDLVFEDSMESTMKTLAQKIEGALREAKSKHLKCGEILIPSNLTMKIAHLVLRMSENEPCGIRGCIIFLNFEENKNGGSCRRIGSVKCDPNTVATFELHLTLRQDSSWLRHLLPSRWIKSFRRTSAFVVSEAYTMTKKKLYRSSMLY